MNWGGPASTCMELPRFRGRVTSSPIVQLSRICMKTDLQIQGVLILIAFQGKSLPPATPASALPCFNETFPSNAIIGCMLKKSCSGTQNPGWMWGMVLGKITRGGKAPVEQAVERQRTVSAGGTLEGLGEAETNKRAGQSV